ncbi:MAG: hypothetical protein HC821_01925 [Lewinella sp.]|nr:hypothetical protein [Lewinella sp.]
MDIQQYINSGVLELYALGQLPEAEAAEVAAKVKQYPAVAAELALIEENLEALALRHAVTPPPGVLPGILAQLSPRPATPAPTAPPAEAKAGAGLGWLAWGLAALGLGLATYFFGTLGKKTRSTSTCNNATMS